MIHRPAALALSLFAALCVACDDGSAPSTLGPPTEDIGADLTSLITYEIRDGELAAPRAHKVSASLRADRDDAEGHALIWAHARTVFKSHLRWMTRFVVFTDGADETLASVQRRDGAPGEWSLAVDIEDALDEEGEVDLSDFSYTLVHELGHVIALNRDEVVPDPALSADPEDQDAFDAAQAACGRLFLDEGCARPDAYLQAFYEAFWADLAADFAPIDAIDDPDDEAEAVAAFHARHADLFFTEYAATNVTEDFAESWAHYVLGPGPRGDTTLDDKLAFFAEFEELADIRAELRAAGVARAVDLSEVELRAPR